MDQEKLKKACRMILEAIGENPEREGLKKTPIRFAKMWEEVAQGYKAEKNMKEMATTFSGENYDEMIIVRDIEFFSLCEHHLLPVVGTVSVGYIPSDRVVGLSKIPRIVEIFAKRAQNQERLTMQIADALDDILKPKGVAVFISASHMCMTMRGVKKSQSLTDTSAVRGVFRSDAKTRSEFFGLLRR